LYALFESYKGKSQVKGGESQVRGGKSQGKEGGFTTTVYVSEQPERRI